MTHEWIEKNYVIGFVSDRGLMLDLDNVTFRKATRIAERLLKLHRLEGYLIIESSNRNYHVVFNRYLRWKTIMKIILNQYVCIRWGIWQGRKGELTLRVSPKNEGKEQPKIVKRVGKQDKLIADYLEIYGKVEELLKEND